jgi:hypothetical protein
MSKARDLANAGTALTTVSATELGYLDGVTSAVQTQIDSKIGSASAINPTIVDAKGDIIAATAADTVDRLAVGANDTVLTADSTAATGLKWATPAAGGMTLISNTVASTLSSLSLSSIPSTYKHLLLTWSGINHSALNTAFQVRLNNDSGLNYSVAYVYRFGSSFTDIFNQSAYTSITDSSPPFGSDVFQTSLHDMAKGYILIENYASTSLFKSVTGQWTYKPNQFSRVTGMFLNTTWRSTSAVTSIDIVRTEGSATFSNASNTSIRLYGIS